MGEFKLSKIVTTGAHRASLKLNPPVSITAAMLKELSSSGESKLTADEANRLKVAGSEELGRLIANMLSSADFSSAEYTNGTHTLVVREENGKHFADTYHLGRRTSSSQPLAKGATVKVSVGQPRRLAIASVVQPLHAAAAALDVPICEVEVNGVIFYLPCF
jgi:hypothetical protein